MENINLLLHLITKNSGYILASLILCSLLFMISFQFLKFYFQKSKNRIVFFYKHSSSNKVIFYTFLISFVSWMLFTYLMLFSYDDITANNNQISYGFGTSIFTSFLISFLFHITVTLRDANEKDEIAMDAIGSIARAFLTTQELRTKPNDKCPNIIEYNVYKLKNAIMPCDLECTFNIKGYCDYGNNIKIQLFGIKMNLESSYSLISSVKPILSNAIKNASLDVLLADRTTQSGIYVYNDFDSVKSVHIILYSQGSPEFNKINKDNKFITIIDGKYFHKRYLEIIERDKEYISRIKKYGVR